MTHGVMRAAAVIAAAVAFACPSARAASLDVREVSVPWTKAAVRLTGQMASPEWAKAARAEGFNPWGATKEVTQPTQVRVLAGPDALYIGFRCSEQKMPAVRAAIKEHDGMVWKDDSVEILLDPANGQHHTFHMIVNSLGAVMDERVIPGTHTDTAWDSHCRTKAAKGPGYWSVEVAVPYSSLGAKPVPGQVWGANFCRDRYASRQEISSWNPSPDGFVRPSDFGHMVFGGGTQGVMLTSWGALDPDTSAGGENVLELGLTAGSAPARFSAVLSMEKGKTKSQWKASADLQAGQQQALRLPYTPSADASANYRLTVGRNGRQVLAASQPSMALAAQPRVWQTKNPLFKELLSSKAPGEQKNGAIYWFHDLQTEKLRPFAKEYGLRYSLEESYRLLGENHLMPITATSSAQQPDFKTMAQRYGFKALLIPDYRAAWEQGAPAVAGDAFYFDPRSRAVYFRNMADGIQAARPYLWGIYTGDEQHEKVIKQCMEAMGEPTGRNAFILAYDKKVQKESGYGRYDMPHGWNDPDPFRWIAFHRWVNKQLVQWQLDVYNTVRKTAPELKVVSYDPVCGHKPFQQSLLAQGVDVVTHQLYPSANPDRQEFAFITKLAADLTGKPVWPCAHVENYAYTVKPDEARELMSQVMRAGGKGFHLYMPDVIGVSSSKNDTLMTRYGSPDRYRTVMDIVNRTTTMNEVATPADADCGIFYSQDHWASFAGFENIFPNEPEWAFTFLGPVAQAWMRFVDDDQIDARKVDLKPFRAIFVPGAKYERRSAVEALTRYVENGGTLVCGDPGAFSFDPDGSRLTAMRNRLLPATAVSGETGKQVTLARKTSIPGLGGMTLKVYTEACRLKVRPGAEVLARFADGSAAIVRGRVGKGSVICFAFNPYTEKSISDPAWKRFFVTLTRGLGIRTGRSIWRFQYPALSPMKEQMPAGECLTGNHVQWRLEHAVSVANVSLPGSYSYSVQPDAVADRGADNISFAEGKLMDRMRAPETTKDKLRPEDFTVTWKRTDPFTLTLDFGREVSASCVQLWFSGQLPDVTVEGSAGGDSWQQLGAARGQNAGPDVLDTAVTFSATPVRKLRLGFGARSAGALTLAECEVWGTAGR